MPDKECTVNLIELSFAMGQLRADSNRPKGIVSNIIAMLGAWECRKSGDDGKALEGLAVAADNAYKGRPENVTKANFAKMWAEYHSLMKAMGFLDLDIVETPRRAPIPDIGIEEGVYKDSKFRLGDAGFTDYRTVKTTRETQPQTEGGSGQPVQSEEKKVTRPQVGGQIKYSQFTKLCQDQLIATGKTRAEAMKECPALWGTMTPEEKQAGPPWGALSGPEEETPVTPPRRRGRQAATEGGGASRWTPPISRNAILR